MKLIAVILIVFLSWASALPDRSVLTKQETDVITPETGLLTGEELADYINKHQQLFKAEPRADIELLKRKVMKSKFINRNHKPRENDTEIDGSKIPDSFDARVTWPHCPSISYIRDQSVCGSCWAISSAEVMSDRVCIASHGHKKIELSADDIMTCCTDGGYGCDGGYLYAPWKYFIETGVVTGGLYGTKDACRPYEIPPCVIHKNETFYNNPIHESNTPECNTKCQAGYPISYDNDKTFGKTSYNVSYSMSAIQREIMTNGPVVAGFIVYEDFYAYKSGIYKYTYGAEVGGHAVRILGWGEEGGVPYWLIANSWNTKWGEHGYFRMLRGTNECGIEENVVAGQV